MSDTPKQQGMDDQELERHLASLIPESLNSDFTDELMRDCENVLLVNQETRKNHVHWKRLITLSLATCLVVVGYLSYRIDASRISASPPIAEKVPGDVSHTKNTAKESPVLLPSVAPDTGIVPVSSEGFLLRTSSGGVIQSENGPVEEFNLEFQDSYHWRDPVTNTNIRFFTPRKERVLVPLITN